MKDRDTKKNPGRNRTFSVDPNVPRWVCQNCRNPLCIVGVDSYADKFFNDPSRSGMQGSSIHGASSVMSTTKMDNSYVVLPKQRPLAQGVPPRPRGDAAQPGKTMEESFVVVHKSESPGVDSGTHLPPHNSGFNSTISVLTRAFEIATTQTQVEQPLCLDCMRVLSDKLDKEVEDVNRDIEAYEACLKRLEGEAKDVLSEADFLKEKLKTCLSKGRGFHFPPCHMLNFCGLRILLDCPLDLSALVAFSPVPTALDALQFEESNDTEDNAFLHSTAGSEKRRKIEKLLHAKSLLFSEPWYKTVNYLHLWNPSLIDVILISSPMGIMGLPFLTRRKGFSAKIYVTEASARLGQLMMEDLITMHAEFKQFYGSEESNFPPWLKQEELEILPSVLKEILVGKDGVELGGWMPLYSAADVKDCILQIKTLKYAEEACYSGTLVIKAFSSGVEVGGCNWILNAPKGDIAYLSSSCFFSAHAMTFDPRSLKGTSTVIYSDFSSLSDAQDIEDGDNSSDPTCHELSPQSQSLEDLAGFSPNSDINLEESEKLVFISSCAIECVKDGGSVLIPINRLGTILQLLEEMTKSLEALDMKVPIYIISSVAEELLALLNTIPEWLCKQRQERLFAGEHLFAHVKLLEEKKIHVVSDIHSPQLLKNWQEPCIVFCPHWSLRLGPVVHLLRRWCGDTKSLLILEDMVNPEIALLPFKPFAMKVLQCLFPSGIGLQKVQSLLKILQPKTVLYPEELRLQTSFSCEKSFSVLYYTEADTLKVSCQKAELKIATDLESQFEWKNKKEGINIARLKGKLLMENGVLHLLVDEQQQQQSPVSLLDSTS